MDNLLFEQNPNPMLIYDKGTLKILSVNKAFSEKYKYSQEEIEQHEITIKDIRPREDVPKMLELLKTLDDAGINKRSIYRHQSKEGNIFYVQVTAQKFSYHGHDSRLVVCHDVTAQVESEKRIKKALNELQHHINNTPLASIKWDREFKILEWSDQAENIAGYSEEEVKGKNIFAIDFFDQAEAEKIKKNIRDLVRGKHDRNQFETKVEHKDGTEIYIKVYSSSLRNEEGELQSVLTFIEDITEQKKSDIKYQRLFENANDSILILKNGLFVDCNKQTEVLYGAPKHKIIGKSPVYFSPEKQPDGSISATEVSKRINKALETGSNLFEWQHQNTKGDLIDVEVGLNKITFPEGEYLQAIVRDLTDRKESERALRTSLQEKQVLLEEIHHRVKNNLAIVSGLLEMQTMQVDDEQLTRYMQNSQLRIQSMAIVHEMLYKSGTLSEIKFKNYVNKLVTIISNVLEPDSKNITLQVDVDDFTLNVNEAIPCALVISELITNAYEYAFEGREKGKIWIDISESEDIIDVSVKDNGIGLPDDFEQKKDISLGINLMENLCLQLETHLEIERDERETCFSFTFKRTDKPGSSSLNRI